MSFFYDSNVQEVLNHWSGWVNSSIDNPLTELLNRGTIPISLIAAIIFAEGSIYPLSVIESWNITSLLLEYYKVRLL